MQHEVNSPKSSNETAVEIWKEWFGDATRFGGYEWDWSLFELLITTKTKGGQERLEVLRLIRDGLRGWVHRESSGMYKLTWDYVAAGGMGRHPGTKALRIIEGAIAKETEYVLSNAAAHDNERKDTSTGELTDMAADPLAIAYQVLCGAHLIDPDETNLELFAKGLQGAVTVHFHGPKVALASVVNVLVKHSLTSFDWAAFSPNPRNKISPRERMDARAYRRALSRIGSEGDDNSDEKYRSILDQLDKLLGQSQDGTSQSPK